MPIRRLALPFACGAWILGGFGVLALFALATRPRAGLPGLDAFPSAFIGDPVLLPAAGMTLALGVSITAPGPGDRWWAAGGGLLGLAAGLGTQVLWLADDQIATNWTIPRPHHFNAAGIWHAVYLSSTSTLLAALTAVLLVRLRRTARVRPAEVAGILGSPFAAVLWMALLSYVALVVHDSGAAAFASRVTLAALGITTAALVVLVAATLGRLAAAMARPVAFGLLAGGAAAVLGEGAQGGHGQAFGIGLAVNVTVAAALAAYLLLRVPPPDARALFWAALAGTTAALLLCAQWILAMRAHDGRHLVPLLVLAAAQAVTLLVCAVAAGLWRGLPDRLETVATLAAMVWIAGPLAWAAEWVDVAHREVLVGLLLAVVVYWLLYPVVTRRYDAQITVEAKRSREGTLPPEVRRSTAVALALVVLGLLATALALLSQTLEALDSTDFKEGHGGPYRSLFVLGVVGVLVTLCAAALGGLKRRRRLGAWRFLPPLLLVPWCAALLATADTGMLRESAVVSVLLVITSSLCAWWAGNSLLDNVYLLRLRRVDGPGWLLIGLGSLATGLSAYWAGSSALVGDEHPWATLPALLGAFGVLAMGGVLTTVTGQVVAPPARTVTLYGLAHNLTQDAIVIAVLHTFGVVLPVIFLVHVPAGIGSSGLLTTLAVCAPLLTLLGCGYRWTARNSTTHVRREIDGKAADPAAVVTLVQAESRPWQRVKLQWTAARRGLPGPPRNRFLRVLAAHAHNQNLIGVLLLIPLVVGALALVQERSSGVRVPWRD